MRAIILTTVAAAIALGTTLLGTTLPTVARERHPDVVPGAPPPPSRFYPDEIAGGVKGNLPFNNQIRKLKDPLNANGAK